MRRFLICICMMSAASEVAAESFRTSDPNELRANSPLIVEIKTTMKADATYKLIAEMLRKCEERSSRSASIRVAADRMDNGSGTIEVSMATMFKRSILLLTDITPGPDSTNIKAYLGGDGGGFKARSDAMRDWVETGSRLCPGDSPQ